MKVIIDIPEYHKRLIDNVVCDGKEYLLPYEVGRRLERAVKIGTVIPDYATNGDAVKAMFPNIESRLDEKTGIILVKWADGTTKTFKANWWNAPYKDKCALSDPSDEVCNSPDAIATSKWIPVSQSLPDKDDEYLCTVASAEEGFPNYLKLCDYYSGIHKFVVDEYDGEVLAWYSEPLPELYIAESEDKEVGTKNDTYTFWDK